MVVQHNLPALNSHRNLGINNSATAKNLEKLSSGYRINRAGDDAAGLAISEKMRGQIRGLAMAENNAANGISLIQTAEGGLNETHAILQRMRELAVQSSNGTYKDEDRSQIAREVQALKSEIDRIATSTHYNNINLLDGTTGGTVLRSVTADSTADSQLLEDAVEAAIGIDYTIDTSFSTSQTFYDIINGSDVNALGTLTIVRMRNADGTEAMDSTGTHNLYIFSMQVGDKTYVGALTNTADREVALYYNGDEATSVDYGHIELKFLVGANWPTIEGSVSGIDLRDSASGAGTPTTDSISQRAYTNGIVAGKTDKLIFQIGANGTADQRVGLHVDNMSSGAIGSFVTSTYNETGTIAGINVATRDAANAAIAVIDGATKQVSGQRAELGALQNRLEHTLNNLGVTKENLTAAESSIRDVDMAKEMMEFTKNNILVQASQAMLAQANALPQGVLSLLR